MIRSAGTLLSNTQKPEPILLRKSVTMDVDITSVIIGTKRLTLRSFRQEDLTDLNRYASIDGVGQPAGWKPHESMEDSQEILDLFLAGKKTFALVHEGIVIGSLGIESGSSFAYPQLEGKLYKAIGFALAKDYWGQGLMPEAVEAVLKYLFEDHGLDLVLGSFYTHNKRSARVFEKNGFIVLGTRTTTTRFGNDEHVTDIILSRDKWEEMN